MLTTNFAEAGGFIKSRPEEAAARPATALRDRQAGGPWPQDGVRATAISCHVCLLRPKSRGSVHAWPAADPMRRR
jgi:choline dehydrogenase-like flavoprotein